VTSSRPIPPVWLIGLSNTTLGLSTGSFAIDAAVSISACILLGLLLYWIPAEDSVQASNQSIPANHFSRVTDPSLFRRVHSAGPLLLDTIVRPFCQYRNI
jgi:hypothetical protein